MSDSSNETGAPAEKRVRKTRAPKTPAADTAAPAERAADPAPQLPEWSSAMDLTMERPRPLPFEAEIILAAEARLIFSAVFPYQPSNLYPTPLSVVIMSLQLPSDFLSFFINFVREYPRL